MLPQISIQSINQLAKILFKFFVSELLKIILSFADIWFFLVEVGMVSETENLLSLIIHRHILALVVSRR